MPNNYLRQDSFKETWIYLLEISALKWKLLLKPFPIEDKCLFRYVFNIMDAEDLAIQGTMTSTAILQNFYRNFHLYSGLRSRWLIFWLTNCQIRLFQPDSLRWTPDNEIAVTLIEFTYYSRKKPLIDAV